MLDKVLQPSTGIVLGPLWVTKGETFSPKVHYFTVLEIRKFQYIFMEEVRNEMNFHSSIHLSIHSLVHSGSDWDEISHRAKTSNRGAN